MTTILSTRTAPWAICHRSCFGKEDRQIKTAGGTGLKGQDQFKKRYQNFCDDIALYEMMKHVVTGAPMSALVKSHADRDWTNQKNKS